MAMSPEEKLAMEGLERVMNLLEEVDVGLGGALLRDELLALAGADLVDLVCTDVEERAGKDGGELLKPLADEWDGTGLAGRARALP